MNRDNTRSRVYFRTKNNYDLFQVEAGTVDRSNIKTVYFLLKTNYVHNSEDKSEELKMFQRRVKMCIKKHNDYKFFKPLFLFTPTIHKVIGVAPSSFIQLDYTFFITGTTNIGELTRELDRLIGKINTEVFETETDLQFIRKKYHGKPVTNENKVKHFSKDILWEEA